MANIRGSNLDVVEATKVVNYPWDMEDGSYLVEFTLSWSGEYEVYVYMESEPYGEESEKPFRFTGIYSTCPAETPKKCPNEANLCVTDLRQCGIDLLSCADEDNPILCDVDEIPTCVSSRTKCDCPEGLVECPSDGKCVTDSSTCSFTFPG